MNTSGIPIIGQTKTWKSVRFVCQPVANAAAIQVPGVPPAITGWVFGFQGLRSDDLPVQMLAQVQVDKLESIEQMMKSVGVTMQHFESYRTCECEPSQPCGLHRTLQGRPS